MKLQLHINRIIVAAVLLLAAVQAQAVKLDKDHFPDDNFRAQLIFQFGWMPDAEITLEQLNSVIVLNVSGKGIKSLEGIKYFSKLEEIYCQNNSLGYVTLDYLHNVKRLDCSNNLISSIDVRGSSALEYLKCSQNKFETLDISYCHSLVELYCENNQYLKTLNSWVHHKLNVLRCNNTQLSVLITENMTDLRILSCGNTLISSLDLSKNKTLYQLYCSNCNLSQLDMSKQEGLQVLDCSSNVLSELDLSKNSLLTELNCRSSQLTRLVLPSTDNLQILKCNSNHLKELRLSEHPSLRELYCQNNRLTTLDLSANTQLDPEKTILSPNSLSNIWEFSDGRYAIPLYGEDKCFQASRISNLTNLSTNTSYSAELSDGYLVLPSFQSNYRISYNFDTGNSNLEPMQVTGSLSYQGKLTSISSISISGYDWPQDFEPADYEATCDNYGTVTKIYYVMYKKTINNYVGGANDNVACIFAVELNEGYIFAVPNQAHIGYSYSDYTVNNFNNKRARSYEFDYRVPIPEGGIYIRSVKESITEPQVGAYPVFMTQSMNNAPPRAKPTPNYSVDQVLWLQVPPEDMSDDFKFMTPTDQFAGGFYYYLILKLTPVEGYQFCEKTKFTLNNSQDIETMVFPNVKEMTEGIIDIDGPAAMAAFFLEETIPTAIHNTKPQIEDSRWYTIDGRLLTSPPTAPGIYIRNGKKVVKGR